MRKIVLLFTILAMMVSSGAVSFELKAEKGVSSNNIFILSQGLPSCEVVEKIGSTSRQVLICPICGAEIEYIPTMEELLGNKKGITRIPCKNCGEPILCKFQKVIIFRRSLNSKIL